MTTPTIRAAIAAIHLFALPAGAAVVDATFNIPADVPVTAPSYTAADNTVNITLNFAPAPGTCLTVVMNTGMAPIQGTFANLAHGQTVSLAYGGISYAYVANYRGGTGNDLVLQWANIRLLAWGNNGGGQLGNRGLTNSSVAVPVETDGVLAGKTLMSVAAGRGHSLALCSDGTLAAWGYNSFGQLGNGGTSPGRVPLPVVLTGALAGRTIVAIAAGGYHNLALCADGSLAAWGYNLYGQLGNNSTTDSSVPVPVVQTGVLAGRTIVAIAAGNYFNLALCTDGTLAAWGMNSSGQLGNNTTTNSSVPVLVNKSGILANRTVATLAIGAWHAYALCADGTLAAWGNNGNGQLGNNAYTNSSVPVAVNLSGVLAGRTVAALDAGETHGLALCTDGTLATWGYNLYGQLGNNTTITSNVPVSVNLSGVFAGRTTVRSWAGGYHNLALCADGALVAWGYNNSGQLGNNSTTDSTTPVLVDSSALRAGEYYAATLGGGDYSLALVAMPPAPMATTLAAQDITDTQAQLNGSVSANGTSVSVTFEYGLTSTYGSILGATPATVTGSTATAANVTACALLPGTTYHYRIVARGTGGCATGEDMTFTTSAMATLSNMTLGGCTLSPAFTSINSTYLTTVPNATGSITVTPVVAVPSSTVKVNGITVASGTASAPINLQPGENTISIAVTAMDGSNTLTYTVKLTRLVQSITFNSATTVPMTLSDLAAAGTLPAPVLAYAPTAGTSLMIVRNTGSDPIRGMFDNLVQGQRVSLPYNGTTYVFAANYFGGTGNDLVLQWASTCLLAWGSNASGQLGINSTTNSGVAVPVNISGALAGKTVVMSANGYQHALALCADGTMAAWGDNSYGQLGNGTRISSTAPVTVNPNGVLAGKKVIAIATSGTHVLALCADGTLAEWGSYLTGQANNYSSLPALVDQSGVLAGKLVTAIAAGDNHSLALCMDGTLATWGYNTRGQLGNNGNADSSVPVLVSRAGVLAGKTVTTIAAGAWHNLALCADGTLAAWGFNSNGQLGNNSTNNAYVPVAVIQTGVLAGRMITAIAGGGIHTLALCADGILTSWGGNNYGQLGNNTTVDSSVPVGVYQSGTLSGRIIAEISCGGYHSLVRCTGGTVTTWGYNTYGQLGNNSTTNSSVPLAVPMNALESGARVVTAGAGSRHCMAVAALPQAPLVTTLPVSDILGTSATLNGLVSAQGTTATVSIQYGPTTSYGTTTAATPGSVTGTATDTAVSASVSGLLIGATYHYRVIATTGSAVTTGEDMTFTTHSDNAMLMALAINAGELSPAFDRTITSYAITLPFATGTLVLTPTTDHQGASVTVNGVAVARGTASAPISLAVGGTMLTTVVTAEDGITIRTYAIAVTRMPCDPGDSDHDGIPNLIEYALGLDPAANSAGQVPQPARSGKLLVIRFTQPAGVSGITYGAQWSTDMAPGNWTDVPDGGSGAEHVFSVPAGDSRRFLRLKVTSP
jgi:alpha-tubulin suppressor-like RCC1 family protein